MKTYKINTVILIINCFSNIISTNIEIDLYQYEKRLISQNGEDGILQKIFNIIGTTNKYYVEFGAGNGHFCSNVKYLREKYGWSGLLLDGGCANKVCDDVTLNLHQEFITAENICHLFKKYKVPHEFDLISIDIDRNDFYVWKALSTQYKPRVVVIECNPCFNFNEDQVIKYDPYATWDASEASGASMLALFNLGRTLGYSLIYQESSGNNLFFISDDVLVNLRVKFKNMNDVEKLYVGTPKKFNLTRKIFDLKEKKMIENTIEFVPSCTALITQ